MTESVLLIIGDEINNTQRNQIHAAVRSEAKTWWHEMPDVWMVKTDDSAVAWRDRLGVVVGIGGSLLVLGLPDMGGRTWATRGKIGLDWLRDHYGNSPREIDDPWGRSSPDDEPPF